MKKNNYATFSLEQLKDELANLRKEKFNFSFQRATGQLEKVNRVREVRRDIARVMTFFSQKTK